MEEVDAQAAWDRFIAELNRRNPLIFDRNKGPEPHVNFIGSVESYRKIFMEAQKVL